MGDIEEVVLATGVLEPLELVRVGAQASGRIEHLAVKIGDIVEAGQLVAEIDSQNLA
ncbi:biotin/lipoyl-binding protein [Agrobacterium pusense]|nr:biotin/lipoyl-binding protein [Agrobacterium pusense]WFN89396.1 biotin/lipoyl-binding protein [Agrobacterium pusense]